MAEVQPNFIGGAWQSPASVQTAPVYNPATGDVIGRVPLSGRDEVARAVEAAAKAYNDWRETSVYRRADIMFRFKQLLEEHLEELAALITRENGKTLDEARAEMRRGIQSVEFATGVTNHLMGQNLELVGTGVDAELYRQPLGIVVGITPYNFPAMIPLWMFPIAVACGNTFVLKPSELTPLTSIRLADLASQAGLPPGVLNIVHGSRETVEQLITHEHVAAVSFVGSQRVAQSVYSTAASHGKRVQALAGAKNHMIVLPDANLDLATAAIMESAYGCAGQRCMAGSVLLLHEEIADVMLNRLVESCRNLRVGPGDAPGVAMGPLIRDEHRRRVENYIEIGVSEGARLVVDGRSTPLRDQGFFLGPTLFDQVEPHMRIAREEIFGPVLSTSRVKDLDAAIEIINRSPYGNGACLFTGSGGAAREFRRHVRVGMLGINVGVPAPVAVFPFSGWRGSFYGTLHANGEDAVSFYTERKVVTVRWS